MLGLLILIVIIVWVCKRRKKKKQEKIKLEEMRQAEIEENSKTIFMGINGDVESERTQFMWDDVKKQDIVILYEEQSGKTFSKEITETLVIGSSSELCDLQIESDRTISRRHCMIIKRGNEYFLKDLNSSNGTYLNGSKVYMDERPVYHEDHIRLGKTDLKFLLNK